MRTFTIEPHPNQEFESCQDIMVLRSDDRKIHAMSRKQKILKRIKQRMEKYYNGDTQCEKT